MSRVAASGALLLFIVVTLGSAHALAQTAAEIEARIKTHNEQIRALQAEIAGYQRQADTLAKQKNTLQGAIDALALSQKELAARIKITNAKIEQASNELTRLGSAIVDKEETIADDQAAIGNALREIAEGEVGPMVTLLFTSDSLTEAWESADAVREFNRALGEHIEELRLVRAELEVDRDAVSKAKRDLESLQRDLTLQKKQVDLQKAAQQKLLVDTKNQESTYQKLIAEKRAEEAAFEAALFDLASELEYILDPSKIPPAGKGVLRWPLDNVYITQQFGKTSSSGRLYVKGYHDGVDFRASIGTPLRASLTGTVLETNSGAVRYCQYGKWVIIKHNNGLASLYAHLSEINVSKGDFVATGQVIGFSGDTGYATGPHLHFGVYLSDAVSFRQYTCSSGRATMIPIAPLAAYLNPLDYL